MVSTPNDKTAELVNSIIRNAQRRINAIPGVNLRVITAQAENKMTIEGMCQEVAVKLGYAADDWHRQSRKKGYVQLKMILTCMIMHVFPNMTQSQICYMLGYKNHASIRDAVRRVEIATMPGKMYDEELRAKWEAAVVVVEALMGVNVDLWAVSKLS